MIQVFFFYPHALGLEEIKIRSGSCRFIIQSLPKVLEVHLSLLYTEDLKDKCETNVIDAMYTSIRYVRQKIAPGIGSCD